ncbi:MAG: endolytic transglycosylase MltG [Candidatus Methylomirabilales bacterium]
MQIRRHRLATWTVVLGVALMTAFGVRTYRALYPSSDDGKPKVVNIEPESSSTEIAELLKREGIVQDRLLFLLFTTLRGSSDRLMAGEYQFTPSMGLLKVIRTLEEGKVFVHKVTIPEGASVRQIAILLSKEGLVDRERFLQLAMDPGVAGSYVSEAKTLEGFLFPDTYHFIKQEGEEAIIEAMIRRFFRAFPLDDELRARQLGMSLYEIVTLASIVEKEAVIDREKPIIAGVFHNRLKRGMRLQADPTVLYGRGRRGRIRTRDLRTKHPYNTYVRAGLPPGPIASPGVAALKATLYPAQVKYLYFVSKNDGTHHFSRTLEEHNRAVRKYQSRRSRRARSI